MKLHNTESDWGLTLTVRVVTFLVTGALMLGMFDLTHSLTTNHCNKWTLSKLLIFSFFFQNRIQISEQYWAKTWILIVSWVAFRSIYCTDSAVKPTKVHNAEAQQLKLAFLLTQNSEITRTNELENPRPQDYYDAGRNGRQWHLKAESISVSSKLRRKIYTFPSNLSEK